MSKTVRCAECGFLAVRHQFTRELDEVEAEARKKWAWPSTFFQGYKGVHLYSGLPVCFRMAHPLGKEATDQGGHAGASVKTIEAERECESFTKWEQGFTPKEHQEVINAKELRALEAAARKSTDLRLALLAGAFTLLGAIISLVGVWLLRPS